MVAKQGVIGQLAHGQCTLDHAHIVKVIKIEANKASKIAENCVQFINQTCKLSLIKPQVTTPEDENIPPVAWTIRQTRKLPITTSNNPITDWFTAPLLSEPHLTN